MKPKVSIIIPTYNRGHLILETLNSILKQSYSQWECIIVDDGSTDNTSYAIHKFFGEDERIKLFERPVCKKKGANSCRNFGLQKSEGDYIIWFDSDDIMTPDHVEVKVNAMEDSIYNFLVARTVNFKGSEFLEPYKYEKKPYGIKASDFILLNIHWYTYDVIVKRNIADKIQWNENMKSWQDYNYFCKMLLVTENGFYLDKIVTHRRIHSDSIQKALTKNKKTFTTELLENRLLTYCDIKNDIDGETKKELIFGMMNLCFELSAQKIWPKKFEVILKIVIHFLGLRSGNLFVLSIISAYFSGKGFSVLQKAKGR